MQFCAAQSKDAGLAGRTALFDFNPRTTRGLSLRVLD